MEPETTKPNRLVQKLPWGSFEEFSLNERTSVKILTILPGEELSLQAHHYRSEWWIILDESMDVVVDETQVTLHRDQEIFIPAGTKHRVIGRDKPCRWLEIAYGEFLEADITRFDDKYGRA